MENESANRAHRDELLQEIKQFQGSQLRRIRRMLNPPAPRVGYYDDVNRPYNQAYLPHDLYEMVVRA